MVVNDPASEATVAAFCKAFREAREASGKKQEEVAIISGRSATYISDIERGRQKNLTLKIMMDLAAAVGMHLDVQLKPIPRPRKKS